MAAAARASSSRSSGEGAFASSSASPVAASGSSVADAAGVGASADGAAAAAGCAASACGVAVVPARRPSADGAAAARSCGAATVSVTTIGLPSAAVPSGRAEAGAEAATGGSAARVRALSCAGACFGATGWSGAASETSTIEWTVATTRGFVEISAVFSRATLAVFSCSIWQVCSGRALFRAAKGKCAHWRIGALLLGEPTPSGGPPQGDRP